GEAEYFNGDYNDALSVFNQVIINDPNNVAAQAYQNKINDLLFASSSPSQDPVRSEMLKEVNDDWRMPGVYVGSAASAPDNRTPDIRKLQNIIIPSVDISTPTPLDEVINQLSALSQQYDKDNKGLNFHIAPPANGQPMPKITLREMNAISLQKLLDMAVQDAGYGYYDDGGIIQIAQGANVNAANPNLKTTPPAPDQLVARPPAEVKFPAAVATADNAFSTFALNVSNASYQLALAALRNRRWPDPGATRTEEFLNAFNYHDPAPGDGEAAAFHYDLGQNPIQPGSDLLRVSYQTAADGRDRATPLRLTILLDGSGSMTRADRVATLQAAVRALGGLLRTGDTVSLVTFARTPQVRAVNLPFDHFGDIINIIDTLVPDGGTNMEEALNTAYAIARQNFDLHAQNRVILFTDGAANLGELDPKALAGIVEQNRLFGIALDAYGVGWDGYDDTTLEALTRKSDGRYAFLSGPADVNAAFAQKLAGALTPAAQDVKIQIEFNPQRVTSYRLMGYNNLHLTQQQFRDNSVSAGELAAAEQGAALYDLVLDPAGAGPIGTARARYRDPGTQNFHELSWTIQYSGTPSTFDHATPALRLAAVAGYFAEYLQQSPYAQSATPRGLYDLLRGVPEAFPGDPRPAGLADALTAASALAGN
ncbi:MAG TPA: von Willebrand factor type A domain-containing protein, partial [Opitutales bacterium]|nr:von Willebrand factor type A domain-containing protein [Opitutales bacterium]